MRWSYSVLHQCRFLRHSVCTRSLIEARCTQLDSEGTGQKPTNFILDVAWSALLLMHAYRQWYSNSFSNASAKNASGIRPPSLLPRFSQNYLVAMQRPLTNQKNKVQIDHLHPKRYWNKVHELFTRYFAWVRPKSSFGLYTILGLMSKPWWQASGSQR